MADQGTEGLLSPFLRNQRFRAAMPYLKGRVLDVGCGSGALAKFLEPDSYVGIEINNESLRLAQEKYTGYRFENSLSGIDDKFDTVVSLAVIEHVSNPEEFLINLANCLNDSEDSRIVITTPHPSVDWIHDLGAKIGLFSKHANEEHEDLLDKERLFACAEKADLELVLYRKFLAGANQIVVYKKYVGT